MLQCLMRRQAAAEFLQTEPELAAELAAEAASHGPLVLLHLPLSDYRPVNEDGEKLLWKLGCPGRSFWLSRRRHRHNELLFSLAYKSIVHPEGFGGRLEAIGEGQKVPVLV